MKADERLEGVLRHGAGGTDGREAEPLVDGGLLHPVQFDLECGPRRRGCVVEQLRHRDADGAGDCLQQRESGFTPPVLHQGELTARDADPLAELVKGEPGLVAEMADALAKRRKIGHTFDNSERLHIFTSRSDGKVE